jgi:hypothetical protein
MSSKAVILEGFIDVDSVTSASSFVINNQCDVLSGTDYFQNSNYGGSRCKASIDSNNSNHSNDSSNSDNETKSNVPLVWSGKWRFAKEKTCIFNYSYKV